MAHAPNEQEAAKGAGNESGRMRRIRLRQLRTDAKERAAAAQDVTVRAIERNARISLWLVILSAALMVIAAACVGFSVWTTLSEMPS
jgi:mannose/fructose/N-acetylgalactosamine-specific phosphotransferase system component IIC